MHRRSANRSTSRRKYTVDAFEGHVELQDASASSDEAIQYESFSDVEDGTEDFRAPLGPPSDVDSDDVGDGEDEDEDEALASGAGEQVLDDDESIVADEYVEIPASVQAAQRRTGVKRKRKRTRHTPVTLEGDRVYTRGVPDVHISSTNVAQRRTLFLGPESTAAMEAKDWWDEEPTLPSRKKLRESFYVGEEQMERRVEEEMVEWNTKGGVEKCFRQQRLVEISETTAMEFTAVPDAKEASFLVGPFKNQQLFNLPVGGNMRLSDAWPKDRRNSASYKNGFLLNLGARVHCLDWAPHQAGRYQYLAVSVLPKRESSDQSHKEREAPAFTPKVPLKACIRIYVFKQGDEGAIDVEAGCMLDMVLCTEWGDVKEMKFCPTPDGKAAESPGLLAGLWGDGTVKILRLPIPQRGQETRYVRAETAAFTSRPPNTVCTCITWLSRTRLAAGCANGSVAIWNLPVSLASTSPNPRPLIYTHVSTSYILSITSCYPSRPHLLLTISVAGYITLTDSSHAGQSLSSPANTVIGPKSRIVQRGMLWHENLQSAVYSEDSNRVLASPVRRLFTTQGVVRAKSNVTSMAMSPCHPFVLVGSASGDVLATNPMKKMLDNKPNSWQQTWFAHEWRRPTDEKVARGDATINGDGVGSGSEKHASMSAAGLSRVTEGFKLERNFLKNEGSVGHDMYSGVPFATVYEEESAITALAWNPNLQAGGWAAAGMGTGLLRIEDIAT